MGHIYCAKGPRFFILPHHVIKKEHQQTPFFSPSFIPFPFSHLVFSIFFPFYIEKLVASPPSTAFLCRGSLTKGIVQTSL